jgi:hypothetical protein
LESIRFITALKCIDNKNVVVASSDAEIYSVVQGDIETTNRLCQKKKICYLKFILKTALLLFNKSLGLFA